MTSNLPAELALFRFFAKSSLFWFEAGTLLESTHETYARGADALGNPIPAYRGKLLILTYSGKPLELEYATEKIQCIINQPFIAVICNGYFVGYHNYNQGLHYSFGNLPLAVKARIVSSDYFEPQFKTIAWGVAALWASDGYELCSVFLLHGRMDWFVSHIPLILGGFCLYYFLPLTVINRLLIPLHKARATKRVWAVLDYANGAMQQRTLPTAWQEVSRPPRKRGIRARFPALAGLVALVPLGLEAFFYALATKRGEQPEIPTVVGVANWLCLLASGTMFTWALAATRRGRNVAWIVGLFTIMLAGRSEPNPVETLLIPPVRWLQMGLNFWLVFLPLATIWFFVKDVSRAEGT